MILNALTRLDTPPSRQPRHPISRIAPRCPDEGQPFAVSGACDPDQPASRIGWRSCGCGMALLGRQTSACGGRSGVKGQTCDSLRQDGRERVC